MMKVRDFMVWDVISVLPENTIKEVMSMGPWVNRVIGVISRGDVIRNIQQTIVEML
jgi:CBS domain-containing protein